MILNKYHTYFCIYLADFFEWYDKTYLLQCNSNPNLRPCYFLFDLIYLNGESLTKIPYAERTRKLKTLFHEKKGVLMLCDRMKIENSIHLTKCLQYAFADEEGVVIKEQDSKYYPDKRENVGWFKLKPDVS